jgi:hypothetical protein
MSANGLHRLRHDCAWAAIAVLEDLVQDVLSDTELPEFRAHVYEVLIALLEKYDEAVDRQARRLRPHHN